MRKRNERAGLVLFGSALFLILIALSGMARACSTDADCLCSSGMPYCVGGSCSPCCLGCYYTGSGTCVNGNNGPCSCPRTPTDCEISTTTTATTTTSTASSTTSTGTTTTSTGTTTTSTIPAESTGTAEGCLNFCSSGPQSNSCSGSTLDIDSSGGAPSPCYITETIETSFSKSGAQPPSPTTAGPTLSSPASDVNNYNVGNTGGLLTCPVSKPAANPTDNSYFYTGAVANLAGDACYNTGPATLNTKVTLKTDIGSIGYTIDSQNICDDCGGGLPDCYDVILGDSVANAVVDNKLSVSTPASASFSLFAYSPMLSSGGSQGVISSGFSTNTYIFKQIPLSAQHLIWTWSAEFADFDDNAQIDSQVFDLQNLETTYDWNNLMFAPPSCGNSDCSPAVWDWSCAVKYTLAVTTTLDSIHNVAIPFTEVTNPSASPPTTGSFTSKIVPRFSLGFTMPAPYSQTMSRSYDVFSPFNYYTPGNSIEMYPVNTSDAFFVNYKGFLLSQPVNSLSSSVLLGSGLDAESAVVDNWYTSLTKLGAEITSAASPIENALELLLGIPEAPTSGLLNPTISNPISVTGTATGYVFVLNQSTGLCGTESGVISEAGGDYCLNILQPIPKGYYNGANLQPDVPDTSNPAEFANGWSAFWGNVITVQDQNMYLLNSIDLNALVTEDDPKLASLGFTPFNISTDANGDVFIVAQNYFTAPSGAGLLSKYTVVIEVTNTLGTGDMNIVTSDIDDANNLPATQEIAASPTGGLVFTASPSDGVIYSFGPSLTYEGPVDLAYTGGGGELNISDYLYKGGLFGLKFDGVGSDPSNVLGSGGVSYSDAAYDYDIDSYHHPLGLQDVNGYLYVLDDWNAGLGMVGGCTQFLFWCLGGSRATNLNLLSIRMLNSTGANLPINPTLVNDMWQQPCGVSNPSDLNCQTSDVAPPAGDCGPQGVCQWVDTSGLLGCNIWTQGLTKNYAFSCEGTATKSANYYSLTTGSYTSSATYPPYGWILSASVQVTGGAPITFCSSASCTYHPGSMPSAYSADYPAAGPMLPQSYSYPNVGFSVNFNHTVTLLLSGTSYQFPELLSAQLDVENYTKLFGGGVPYTCYTSTQQGGSCSQLAQVSNMQGPTYTLTNPMTYIESFGSTASILKFEGQVYSSLPQSSTGSSQGINDAGQPSLTIQQAPVDWGQIDQISSTAATGTDNVNLYINGGNPVASGTGTVSYVICDVPADCLAPGSYAVTATDTNTMSTTLATLKVEATPVITMTSTEIDYSQTAGCTPQDVLTANAPSSTDGVTLSIYNLQENNLEIASSPGTGSATYTIPTSGGLCNILSPGAYNVVAVDTSHNTQSSQSLVVVSENEPPAPKTVITPETLTSTMSGYVIVPYEYQYTMTESWQNAQEDTSKESTVYTPSCCCSGSGPCTCPLPQTTLGSAECYAPNQAVPSGTVTATNTVYSYAIVDANSDSLSALVEGGATYLQNLATSSLYVPNLSDAGAIIPPQLLYSIENNRLVGDIHVNDTMCLPAPGSGLNCASNTQVVMNATEQMDYYVDNYAIGPGASWETLDAEYYGPLYGASLLTGAAAALTTPGNVLSFSYNSKPELGFIPLFEFYQAVSYISPMYLYLNASGYTSSAGGTASSLGYHRIIYTFEDTFGNKIVAPMDVDIAYPTTIRLSVVPNVDPSNENQTVLAINGIAGSYSNLGQTFTPLPAGETIYLYYDNNLNFVNYNPLTDPTDAVACAYSVNGLASQLDCTPSNPLYTGRTQNADVVSFRPAYNSIGACNPPPNSLLLNGYPQCNLYGIGALVRCPYSTAGTPEYCLPIFANGTGLCTPQLGLFGEVQTGSGGSFGDTITVCGYRQDSIIAQYYGYPGPEPIPVTQVPLAHASDNVNGGGATLTTDEFNYYYAPNVTQTIFQIGLFELGYGNLDTLALFATFATTLLLLLGKRTGGKRRAVKVKRRSRRERKGR